MLTNIAMIVLAIAILIAVTAIFIISRKYSSDEPNRSEYISSRIIHDKLKRLETKVQPLIEEREQQIKEDSYRKYNEWKFYTEGHYFRSEIEHLCVKCHSDTLEINTNYKKELNENYVSFRPDILRNSYPLSAELKCKTCGHIEKQWEYKGD